jgi:hypothetical protein
LQLIVTSFLALLIIINFNPVLNLMRMKKQLIYASVIAILFAVVGCESNEPSLKRLNIDMVAETSASSRAFTGGRIACEGDTVIFNSFLVGVTEVSLKQKEYGERRCKGDDDDDLNHEGDDDQIDQDTSEWTVEGEFVVDVLAGTSTPDISAELPPDSITFHKMEIEFAPVLPDSNSVFINATVIHDGDSLDVEFATSREFEIHLKRRQGIEISPALDKLLVAFSVDKLFAGVDWSWATADEDGVIRLQNPANTYFYFKVKHNFIRLMRWGHDKDHNHHMDKDDDGDDDDDDDD